jgi:hypothetical protein
LVIAPQGRFSQTAWQTGPEKKLIDITFVWTESSISIQHTLKILHFGLMTIGEHELKTFPIAGELTARHISD